MHGLNWYDFHARQYDPIFGRFHTVDPLAEKYYNISPYVYCANNPLKYIDPTGMYYTYNWSRKQYENEYEYGDKVEWSEVFLWLMTPDFLKTDQDQEWGSLYIYAVEAFVTLSAYLANSGKGYLGHSWIEIESKNGELTSFGTFRKGAVSAEFQINYEKINDYKNTSRNAYNITSITNKQRLLIDIFNLKKENREWGYLHNCTDYAVNLWNYVTGDNLYPNNSYRTPTFLYNEFRQIAIPIYLPEKNESE